MDVRDYFAGQALTGLMQEEQDYSKGKNIKKLVAAAYQIADAMLDARERPSQPVLLMEESVHAEEAGDSADENGKDGKKNKKAKKSGDDDGKSGG